MSALEEIAIDLEAQRAVGDADTAIGQRAQRTGIAQWFAQLNVGRKIQTIFTLNLAISLVAGLAVIAGYIELGNRAEHIANEHEYAMESERLVAVLSEAQRHAEMLVASGEAVREDAALERLTAADQKISELRSMVLAQDTTVQERLAIIEAGIADFRRQIRAFEPNGDNMVRREENVAKVQATGSLTLEASRDLAEILSTRAKALSDAGEALIATMLIAFILFAATLFAITVLAQRFFDRHVGKALKSMTAEMKKLAKGNSDVSISGKHRQDEIGDMARALEIFVMAGTRLERLSRERADKARAELDEQARLKEQEDKARVDRERVLRDVADQFERTVGEVVTGVAEASTQLQTTSTLMANTAEETGERAIGLSSAMADANSGATAAAAASDEFALSIGEISRQAASSAELARQASGSATKADETISALADSASQVGQIVELIQTIAQRTNLLALNASIEAARGGEAGRGFAVVASEVKELAMQTSRATEQVADQIRAMQDTTGASVDALRSIACQVQELESTAVSIASAVDQQSVAGRDLARSIDLAANGTEQVAGHIDDVRDLALSTGSAANQVLSSATNLEGQASILRVQVDEFLNKVRAS